MPRRFQSHDDLLLFIRDGYLYRPFLRFFKAFPVVVESERFLSDFASPRVNRPDIVLVAADIASNNERAIVDEADLVILLELALGLKIPPGFGLQVIKKELPPSFEFFIAHRNTDSLKL